MSGMEPKLSEPAIRFRSPMGSFPNTNLSPEEARKHMENIEAARESDFKPGSCDHEWSGRDGRCGMCGVRQSDEGTGVDRALNPDVTRNAMSPDELWAMQEKPHVSDDAPDMGPIPGTEGIESDPPVSDLSVEGSPPGGNQVPESPLRTHCPHGTYLHDDICMMPECFVMQHSHIEAELMHAKAERDTLKARADYLNTALNEAYAKMAVLKDSLSDALNYRRFYRDEHKECERLREALRIARDFVIAIDYESLPMFGSRRVEMVQSIDTILGETPE